MRTQPERGTSLPDYDPATLVSSEVVLIEAPASVVWEVLVDLPRYGEWNPLCLAAESSLEMGAPVHMTLADVAGGGQPYPYVEHVCAFVPERLLSWELRTTEDCTDEARRDQVIEPVDAERCRYWSTDAFLGARAADIMAEHGAWVKQSFDATAVALKERSEALHRARRLADQASLFSSHRLGRAAVVEIANRVVMAPMTRARCADTVPGELSARYYSQRASAGLVVTEGVPISPQAQGYALVPGLYTDEQAAGWRHTTQAVHAVGGVIFAQLWHVGRLSHSSLQPEGVAPVAPSAVVARDVQTYAMSPDGEVGFVPVTAPRALLSDEIPGLVADFARAAATARECGFDGVEVHAANGYLVEQFLNPATNQRTDGYGGSIAARVRFLLEVVDASLASAGPGRVGVRLSPFSGLFDMPTYAEAEATYLHLADELASRPVAYVHLADQVPDGERALSHDFLRAFGERAATTLILAGQLDATLAQSLIEAGLIDLAAFGQPYIANPDLVARMENSWPLTAPDPTTIYGGGATGYVDYPAYAAP